jgi:maltose alpha-D-glucosyltransferase/alpha-amylase
VAAIEETAAIASSDQWVNFLRNHDEIDLGRLSAKERQDVFRAFGQRRNMQLYNRGIRRRVASMLGGDRRRIEMAFSLTLSLPGTPVVYYGDEIGMGEDLSLKERDPVRTPMQWSSGANGGFSIAARDSLCARPIARGPFSYRRVNVAEQRHDAASLLSWFRRAVRVRKESHEIGSGEWTVLPTGSKKVLALQYLDGGRRLTTLHNLSPGSERVRLDGRNLVDVFADRTYEPPRASIELDGYGYRWLRERNSL